MQEDRIIAIGLLTRANLEMLGNSLRHVIPLSNDDRFNDILKALDEAELSRSDR